MKVRFLILSFITLLLFCDKNHAVNNQSSDISEPPTQTLKIMPLGDSYTQGSSVENGDYGGYRHKLYDLLTLNEADFDFVGSQKSGDFADNDHEGHGGWVCDYSICTEFPDWAVPNWGLMQWIKTWQKNSEPDIVLLFAGINDMHSGFNVSPQNCANAQSALMDTLIKYNSDIQIYVSKHIESTSEKNVQLNQYLAQVVNDKFEAGKAVYIINAFKNFDATIHLDSSYHPNQTGYDIMAGNWFEAIKGMFCIKD